MSLAHRWDQGHALMHSGTRVFIDEHCFCYGIKQDELVSWNEQDLTPCDHHETVSLLFITTKMRTDDSACPVTVATVMWEQRSKHTSGRKS